MKTVFFQCPGIKIIIGGRDIDFRQGAEFVTVALPGVIPFRVIHRVLQIVARRRGLADLTRAGLRILIRKTGIPATDLQVVFRQPAQVLDDGHKQLFYLVIGDRSLFPEKQCQGAGPLVHAVKANTGVHPRCCPVRIVRSVRIRNYLTRLFPAESRQRLL